MAPNSLSICLISMFIVTTVVFSDGCPHPCTCTHPRKGPKVDCSSKGIQELRIDQLPRHTIDLDLSDNQIRIIRRNSFPASKSVKRLDLKRNHIEYIEPGAFEKFPNLVKLHLQVNQLKRIEKDTFSGLKNIKQLNVSQNKLINIHKDAFSSFKKLRRISLKENYLTTFSEYTFPNSSKIELDGNELICDCAMSWLVRKSASKKRGATFNSKCSYPKALAGKQLKKLGGHKWDCRGVEFELPGFKVSPSRNQVVFQNDSFQLTCSSLWQPRGQLVWKVNERSLRDIYVRDQHDVNSRKNKSVLTINRAGLHHNGIYVCQAIMGNGLENLKQVSVSVVGWETRFCPLQRLSTEKGKFSWHSTVSGATATSECPFDQRRIAKRNCTSGRWEAADISNCSYENLLTRKLDSLSKREINQTSLRQILFDLMHLAKKCQTNFTETKQLHYLFRIFANIGAAKISMRQKVETDIRKCIANVFTCIMSMSDAAYANSGANIERAIARLVPVLESFMKDSLDRELQSKTEDVPVVLPVTSKVAAYSQSYIYAKDLHLTLTCSVLFKNRTYPNAKTFGKCNRSPNMTNLIEGFDAQIVIPIDLFYMATHFHLGGPYQLINVTFIGFKSPKLFGDLQLDGISSKTKNTTISSAVIGIHVQVPGLKNADILTQVVMSFKHLKAGINPKLIYWSDSGESEKNQWEINTKCKLNASNGRHSKFTCFALPGRMTYFAMVMVTLYKNATSVCGRKRPYGVDGRWAQPRDKWSPFAAWLCSRTETRENVHLNEEITKETRAVASFDLEFVTNVGASICVLFLLLTFLTYASFRELRYNRNDAATLMNLCFALVVAVVLFVTGINRVDNSLLCQAFAVLLHYFLLCCLLWVGCGGACMTVLVRKGPDKEEYNPVLKYYLIAWGIPMIVCGITLAGNAKNYNITNYCWLTSHASIGAFIIPGGLIVTINMIIFLRLHNLVNRRFPEPVSNRADDAVQVNYNSRRDEIAALGDFHFPDRSELLDFVKGSLLVMLILCIDCGFVVMIFVNRKGSSRYLYHLFSYGFAIANMILGLAVFIFHCVRREDVHVCWRSVFNRIRGSVDERNTHEVEPFLEPLNHPVLTSPLRSNGRITKVNSEHNNEHSDVVSALSAAHSHFTHDIPSSRPSSIFGPSGSDAKNLGKQGFGKLTLPSYDNNKPAQRASESESAAPQAVPTAPPLPLTGFAPYPPSSIPETVQLTSDPPASIPVQNTIIQNSGTPDFTITTVSERTFSDASNLHSEVRSGVKHFEPLREIVNSDHISMPSHVDPLLRAAQNPCVPLQTIVAPNWKPVRRGGSSAVFYPYVDPNFKSLQSPGPSSLNSVLSNAQQPVPSAPKIEPLSTMGPFTIPHRSEVIGATNCSKTSSVGNQTDIDQVPKRQSDNEAKIQPENEIQPENKVNKIRKSRTTSGRRRRIRSRTRFDDLPVEKCLIYVPLVEEQEPQIPIGNETSV